MFYPFPKSIGEFIKRFTFCLLVCLIAVKIFT